MSTDDTTGIDSTPEPIETPTFTEATAAPVEATEPAAASGVAADSGVEGQLHAATEAGGASPVSPVSQRHTAEAPAAAPTTNFVFDQRPLYLSIAALLVSVITWAWVVLLPSLTGGAEDSATTAPTSSTTQPTTSNQPQPTVPSLTPTGTQVAPPNLNA
ncbi:MAG: hypothetical protein LBC29_02095, partial [Propionibacteriaceae bacterium]|nr:hypothetical protein [Propionibacteriaceae bacterium]